MPIIPETESNQSFNTSECTLPLSTVNPEGIVTEICPHLEFLALNQYLDEGFEAASPTFSYPASTPTHIAVCRLPLTPNADNPTSAACEPYARKANYQVRPSKTNG